DRSPINQPEGDMFVSLGVVPTAGIANSEGEKADEQTESTIDSPLESLGSMTANEKEATSLISPDERFYLQLDNHIITVHDMNSAETIKTFAVPIEGEINFIGWHEQGIEFYIEVVDESQRSHNITFALGL